MVSWLVIRDGDKDSGALTAFANACRDHGKSIQIVRDANVRTKQYAEQALLNAGPVDAIIYWPMVADGLGQEDGSEGEVLFEGTIRGLFHILRSGVSVATSPTKFVLVTSTLGARGVPGQGYRCAALHGCEGMMETASIEFSDLGHFCLCFDIGVGSDANEVANNLYTGINSTGEVLEDLSAHSRSIVGGEHARAAVRDQLRWLSEEVEDWKFLTVPDA